MFTHVAAVRMLCYRAGQLRVASSPKAIMETCVAKYFASTTAYKAASDAVQIHGATGCSAGSPVQRYFRDAKIMEIIEGTSQIQQMLIADYAYRYTGGHENFVEAALQHQLDEHHAISAGMGIGLGGDGDVPGISVGVTYTLSF